MSDGDMVLWCSARLYILLSLFILPKTLQFSVKLEMEQLIHIVSSEDTTIKKLLTPKGDVDLLNS